MPVRVTANLNQTDTGIAVGSVGDNADGAARASTFYVYLNGHLHSVIRGNEAFLCDTVTALAHLHPEDRWCYSPVRRPEGFGP